MVLAQVYKNGSWKREETDQLLYSHLIYDNEETAEIWGGKNGVYNKYLTWITDSNVKG